MAHLNLDTLKSWTMNSSAPIVNPWHTCARVTVVRSVCVSVNQHLISGESDCPENDITYSTGNKVKQFVWISLNMLFFKVMVSFVML